MGIQSEKVQNIIARLGKMILGIRTYASPEEGRNLLSERVGILSLASRTYNNYMIDL